MADIVFATRDGIFNYALALFVSTVIPSIDSASACYLSTGSDTELVQSIQKIAPRDSTLVVFHQSPDFAHILSSAGIDANRVISVPVQGENIGFEDPVGIEELGELQPGGVLQIPFSWLNYGSEQLEKLAKLFERLQSL